METAEHHNTRWFKLLLEKWNSEILESENYQLGHDILVIYEDRSDNNWAENSLKFLLKKWNNEILDRESYYLGHDIVVI